MSPRQIRQPLELIHSVPGRVRIHVPEGSDLCPNEVERRAQRLSGVHSVVANPLTRNVLIRFHPQRVSPESLLALLQPGRKLSPRPRSGGRSKPGSAGPLAVLGHGPAIVGLILSLVSCSSPLGWCRLALETLQLCGELSAPASA